MRRYYFDGLQRYSLRLEHAGYSGGKERVRYTFKRTNERTPIFTGDDFLCSPMDDGESLAAAKSLMGFLTLRSGDTDDDYFADYTPEQLVFAAHEAEMLSANYDF